MVIRYKPLICGMSLGILLFISLYGNIFAHELGHYFAANHFNLQPQMHLFDNSADNKYSFFNAQFYTTYTNPSSQESYVDFVIALAGPLTNIFIGLILLCVYFAIPKTMRMLKLGILMLLMPTILSIISNLIPVPGTDGRIICNYLR
ncbi:MAG: hypothetical protein QW063_01510 [Candidatus Nanoarchaeia archaeon]